MQVSGLRKLQHHLMAVTKNIETNGFLMSKSVFSLNQPKFWSFLNSTICKPNVFLYDWNVRKMKLL